MTCAKISSGIFSYYGYDKGGRLITISDSTGAQIEYAYNERNQRIMEKQKISGSIWQERHYEYSPAGNYFLFLIFY